MELHGKVGMVTGGAQGIGRAYCHKLISVGIKVAICDRNEVKGESLAKELNNIRTDSTVYLLCDVTNEKQLEECFKKTLSTFGRIDILINNAGILNDNPNCWRKEIETNLCAVIQGTLFGLKYLQPGGCIVMTGSLAGISRDSIFPIYAATKGGINSFVRSIGSPTQSKMTEIRVISICPSLTDTPLLSDMSGGRTMFPASHLGKLAMERLQTLPREKPETVADCLVHVLKSAPSGSIWLVKNGHWVEIENSIDNYKYS